MTIEQRLERLESIEAIRQLIVQYSRAVDASDLDQLAALWTDDARIGGVGDGVKVGRQAVKDWFGSTDAFGKPRCHFMGSPLIEFTGPDTAKGLVYANAFVENQPGSWRRTVLRYDDRYARQDGQWLFRSRRPTSWLSGAIEA